MGNESSSATVIAIVASAVSRAANVSETVRREALRLLAEGPAPRVGRSGWPARRAAELLNAAEAELSDAALRHRSAADKAAAAAAVEEAAEVGWEVRRELGFSTGGFGPPWAAYRNVASTMTKREASEEASRRNRRVAGAWGAFIS